MLNYRTLLMVLSFIVFDFITGIIKAWKNGTINSTRMREGLCNKLVELGAVIFGYFCEYAMPIIGVKLEIELGSIIALYISLMETFSVIENIGEIYPPVGEILSSVFEKLKSAKEIEGKHEKN